MVWSEDADTELEKLLTVSMLWQNIDKIWLGEILDIRPCANQAFNTYFSCLLAVYFFSV